MQELDFVFVHIWGAPIRRETVGNLRQAGFIQPSGADLLFDIVKRIEAVTPTEPVIMAAEGQPGRI
jgi:hypothetical protein